MTALRQDSGWGETAERLMDLVHAQQRTLDDGDIEGFAHLVAERGRVQEELLVLAAQLVRPDEQRALGQLLQHVAAVDRASFAAAGRAMADISAELGRVRQGRSALYGYAITTLSLL